MDTAYTPLLPDTSQEYARLVARKKFFQSVIEQGHASIDSQSATAAQLAGFISSLQAMNAAKQMLAVTNWQLHELLLIITGNDRCPLTYVSLHEPYPI